MSEDSGLRRRRKVEGTCGSLFTDAEIAMAAVLHNTYRQERRRYEAQAGMPTRFSELRWENNFAALAREATDENIENRTRDGRPRSNRQRLWLTIARKMIAMRIDPQKFIRRVFAGTDLVQGIPQPEYFATDNAIRDYEAAGSKMDVEIRGGFRVSIDNFAIELTRVPAMLRAKGSCYAWAYVLSDTNSSFGALFRYCMAVRLRGDKTCDDPQMFERIADLYRVDAAMDYLFAADLYDRHWHDLLPAGFRDQATQIYDQVYSRPVAGGDDEFSS